MRPSDAARKLLRDAGYPAHQVTARQDGSQLRVTIRDARVSLSAVLAIVAPLECVRHDEATGEILCGGNTYLDVEYHDSVIAPYLDAARVKLASVVPGHSVRIGFHVAHQTVNPRLPWDVEVQTSTLLESGRKVCAHGIDHGLRQVVADNLSRGAYRGAAISDPLEEIEI